VGGARGRRGGGKNPGHALSALSHLVTTRVPAGHPSSPVPPTRGTVLYALGGLTEALVGPESGGGPPGCPTEGPWRGKAGRTAGGSPWPVCGLLDTAPGLRDAGPKVGNMWGKPPLP